MPLISKHVTATWEPSCCSGWFNNVYLSTVFLDFIVSKCVSFVALVMIKKEKKLFNKLNETAYTGAV